MQAYTQDEMRSAGFSNRCFQFVEETIHDQTIFGYKVNSPTPHQEIKIPCSYVSENCSRIEKSRISTTKPKC